MKLTPTVDQLPVATAYLDAFLDQVICSPKTNIALRTVLEEVFMNIVNHSGATFVQFTISQIGKELLLQFVDNGHPFDPLIQQAPDITLPAEERKIGGLGILMVKRMTDRQHYERVEGENRLTLAKQLH